MELVQGKPHPRLEGSRASYYRTATATTTSSGGGSGGCIAG
ncbi:hypothetical protein PF004_g24789 [Phytophthora fragariae]|uniref:Uncharacterized protein n=1 Tax=Phytophthora fragariae TaxID=53985 RepID=A0A6G0MT60_9STRA|nr:hypothetical protein PF004_g24789 [Phytophthora fragariae]